MPNTSVSFDSDHEHRIHHSAITDITQMTSHGHQGNHDNLGYHGNHREATQHDIPLLEKK